MFLFRLLLLLALTSLARAAVIVDGNIQRPEGSRHYLLALPTNLPAGQHPLVILLHGHLGNAAGVFGQTGHASPLSVWLTIADRENVLVAALDGVKGRDGKTGWNDCRDDASNNPQTDDVGFVAAVMDRLIHDNPQAAAGAVHAVTEAHAALKAQPELAGDVAAKLFPPQEAALIVDLIKRDLPYYDATISRDFVGGMNAFARDVGILSGHPAYTDVVAEQFTELWKA